MMSRTGCLQLQLGGDASQDCAAFLGEHWVDGRCPLTRDVTLTGYNTYGFTQEAHSPKQQQALTLLIKPKHVPTARKNIPGFLSMETLIKIQIERLLGTEVQLHSAHGLRQGPATASSTVFQLHQDDTEFPTICISASVKLTGDIPGEGPSRMFVPGAPDHFEYAPRSGTTSVFFSSLKHSSVTPTSEREHLKMVYFFSKVSNICLKISIN